MDLSENPLQQLHPQQLPPGLKELQCAGCQLCGAVPPSIAKHLPALEQLVLAANSLTSADALFSCQQLVHVGLAYNHLSTLVSTGTDASRPSRQSSSSSTAAADPSKTALSSSSIMCLDLSHNDISNLPLILAQLQQLPKLRALRLQGNPVALLPHYKPAILQQLPQLVYLDGQVGIRCAHTVRQGDLETPLRLRCTAALLRCRQPPQQEPCLACIAPQPSHQHVQP